MKYNCICRKICAVVCFFMVLAIVTVSFAASAPQEVLDARKGVARIVCEYLSEDMTVFGSGFAVGDSEYVDFIVTNYHVIENEPSTITVITDSNVKTKATVYATLPSSDLAVLQLNEPINEMQPLRLNIDDMESNTGAEVYALGFPLAADYVFDEADTFSEQVSITSGIISSVKPVSGFTDSPKSVQTYQIDVPISGGNSGGPLVNGKGEVIGINSFGLGAEGKVLLSAENINGAISSLELTHFLDDLEIGYYQGGNGQFPVWAIVVIVAVAAVLIVLLWIRKKKRSAGMMKKKGKGNGLTLSNYLETTHTPFAFDHALRLLAPVAYQLAQMNSQMKWYGNIAPDNILVDEKTGMTQLKEPLTVVANGNNVVISPGYSPLEKYRADIMDGGYTDVFGFAAVLYRILFRTDPPEIFSRMQNDQTVINNINALPVYDQYKQAFLKCLNPDPRERFQNMGELITALSIAPPITSQMNPAAPDMPAGAEKPQKNRKKLLWLIPIGAVAAVAIVCGVLFTQNAGVVKAAEKLLDQERYAQAMQKYDTAYFLSEGDRLNYAMAQAGAAFQDESYEKALDYMKDVPQGEKADELKKEIMLAYSEELYLDDKTQEALDMLKTYEGEKEFNQKIANIICLEADWQFTNDEDENGYEWLSKLPDTQEARDEIKYWAPVWAETWYEEAGDYEKTIGILQHIPFQDEKRVRDSIEEIVLWEAAYAFEVSDFAHVSELMALLEDNEEYTGLSEVYKAMDLVNKGELGEARAILRGLVEQGVESAEETLKAINDEDYLHTLVDGWWYNPIYYYVWDETGWATDLPLTNTATIQRIKDGQLQFLNGNNETVVVYEIWKATGDELVLKNESGELYEFESMS